MAQGSKGLGLGVMGWLVGAAALLWALVPGAGADPMPTVLHEYFDPHAVVVTTQEMDAAAAAADAVGGAPDGIGEGRGNGSPEAGSDEAQGAPVYGTAGSRVDDGFAFDARTEREGMLSYHAVFSPSVIPYKRMSVFDEVQVRDGVLSLALSSQSLRPVSLAARGSAVGWEHFIGELAVMAGDGQVIRLPSVAPEAVVLWAETKPGREVLFFKDAADGFYVAVSGEGQVTLTFGMAAEPGYFSPAPLADGVKCRDLRRQGKVPPFPSAARGLAKEAAQLIGVSPGDKVAVALPRMVRFFRDFEALALEGGAPGGDPFLEVVRSQRGVCRHRAFAFVVVAQYLGIPARLVANEAHVFVEVWMVGAGWLRIDLGGGAEGLNVIGGAGKREHVASDAGLMSEAEERGEGAVSRRSVERAGFSRVEGLDGAATAMPRGEQGSEVGSDAEAGGALVDDAGRWQVGDPRLPTVLRVNVLPGAVLRGESLEVAGRLEGADAQAIVDAEVTLVLASAAQRLVVGRAKTSAAGSFVVLVELPPTLALGIWDLHVVFAGDEKYRPSRSE